MRPAASVWVTERSRAAVSAAWRLATTCSMPVRAASGVVVPLSMSVRTFEIWARPGRAPASTPSTALMKASTPWRRRPASWRAFTQTVSRDTPSTPVRPAILPESAAKASVIRPAALCRV